MKNATRLYRALLRLYPRSYRETFSSQMRQTFIDHYNDVQASKGHVSLTFWFSTLTDETQNIMRQQLNTFMQNNQFFKPNVWKFLLSAVFLLPLYIVFCLVFINLSLALPHPHTNGFGALFALAAVLLVLPGAASLLASYVLASTFINLLPRRHTSTPA